MNIRYSVLLITCCILAFSRIASASELFTCNAREYMSVPISKSVSALLYDFALTVELESDKFVLTTYKGTNAVGILATNVVVTYAGFMRFIPKIYGTSKLQAPQYLGRTYTNNIYGVAQREESKFSNIDSCHIMLLSTEMENVGANGIIANAIRRLAEACIEVKYCQKIGTMKPQRMELLPDKNISNVLLTCPESHVIMNDNCTIQYDTDNEQPVLNKAVDVALIEISEKLRALNGDTLPISDVNQNFSTGASIFETRGYFKATNGTFRDLTTLRRLSDVTIAHMKDKVILTCEFELEIAELNFPHYELEYGFITKNGSFKVSVNNSTIALSVAVDYNRQPCRALVENLKVTKLGDISIQFTDLGPLDWMISQLLNLISIKWVEEVVMDLEEQLFLYADEKVSSVNCEKYRSMQIIN